MVESITGKPNRREFFRIVSAGSLACLGCGHLFASLQDPQKKSPPPQHKFQADSQMSYAQVFMVSYRNQVELLRVLSDKIGEEKFLDMLKAASSEAAAKGMKMLAAQSPKNDLETFTVPMKKPNRFWKHVLTKTILKDTAEEFKIKVTECIWATTFKKLKATDIGYAITCHPDFAMASAFNPRLKILRTQTLMQGQDHCDHHWMYQA